MIVFHKNNCNNVYKFQVKKVKKSISKTAVKQVRRAVTRKKINKNNKEFLKALGFTT